MRSPGVSLIEAERKRQVQEEGWTPDHDDQHEDEELALAAAIYATPEISRDYDKVEPPRAPIKWPWAWFWWKPTPRDRVRELAKAGALIAAEIDRLLRFEREQEDRLSLEEEGETVELGDPVPSGNPPTRLEQAREQALRDALAAVRDAEGESVDDFTRRQEGRVFATRAIERLLDEAKGGTDEQK